jgi:hypothetical protein
MPTTHGRIFLNNQKLRPGGASFCCTERAILVSMPPEKENESSLDRLNKRLYENKPLPTPTPDTLDLRSGHEAPHAWENTEIPTPMPRAPKKKTSFAVLFFAGAVLFFVVAGALAAWLLLSGDRSVSTSNVDIKIEGPTSIAAGDTVPLQITLDNRNPASLDHADLVITFPDGTRSADDVTQSYPRYEEKFDSIAPGASLSRTVKAVIFGQEGQSITIPIELTYRAQGSNATFKKTENYTLTITTAPLSINVGALSQTSSGQPFTLNIEVRSNATAPIPGVVLEANSPFGFTVTSASPTPNDSGGFPLGTLQPGDTKTVRITGVLVGQDSEARVFHFTAGTAGASGAIAVAYTTKDAPVTITAPFISTSLSLDGTTGNSLSVPAGKTVSGTLTWTNTLSSTITNAVVTVQLKGNALDPNSVQANQGFYSSSNQTITFDSTTFPALASLAPGTSGTGSFTFTTRTAGVKNPSLSAVVSVQGQRLDEANVPQNVNATLTSTIKVLSNAALTQAALHSSGVFQNSGPVPPAINQPSTYTIQWGVSNSSNDIAGATVVATLPSYVTFTNKVVPSGSVTYDSGSRKVTWNIGNVTAGQNAQTSFQVSLTPSSSQRGTAPVLVGSATLSGYDRFAGSNVTFTAGSVTTDTTGDSGYRAGNGVVQ